MTEAQPVSKPRSKRICVYWGMALALLLTLGLVCWTVVVPVLREEPASDDSVVEPLRTVTVPVLEPIEHTTTFLKFKRSVTTPVDKNSAQGREIMGKFVTHLASRLHDADPDKRREAAELLGRIGRPASKAVPDLTKALKDKDEEVRQAAAEALKKIKAAQEKKQ